MKRETETGASAPWTSVPPVRAMVENKNEERKIERKKEKRKDKEKPEPVKGTSYARVPLR